MEKELIGGAIFSRIQSDPRVTEDLAYCLYCEVRTSHTSQDINSLPKALDYKIPLDNANAYMKQCPACKRVYILKDRIPTE